MSAAQHSEAEDMLVLVKDLQALDAGSCRKPRHQMHFSDAPYAAVAFDYVTRLQESLVRLRPFKPLHNRPDRLPRCIDLLQQDRANLMRLKLVRMIPADEILFPFQ
jgi:hypothetical protein